METEDNVVEFTGEWHGDSSNDMTDAEYASAMQELLSQVDVDALSRTVAGVLEFLSVRAFADGAYYILNEDGTAITVVAANEDVQPILDSLPISVKAWDDIEDEAVDFLTDRDPGDEQDEPAPIA